MIVICIDASDQDTECPLQVKEGNHYTVTGEGTFYGTPYYNFSGVDDVWGFRKSCYIPLSTIDETELLHNRQSELV